MPKRYKEEFKKQAASYYEECRSLCMVAEKYQVAASAFRERIATPLKLARNLHVFAHESTPTPPL